jgi:pyridoxine kinase
MKELVCMADVVLPNVTECCILTDTPYKEENWTNILIMRIRYS